MTAPLTTGELREIDAKVAERVMGWTIVDRGLSGRNALTGSPPGSLQVRVVPFYSTDIGPAWKVVERLMRDVRHVALHADHEGSACVVTFSDGTELSGNRDDNNIALAICHAALAVASTGHEVTP